MLLVHLDTLFVLYCSAYHLMMERIRLAHGDTTRGHLEFLFDSGSTILRPIPDMKALDSQEGLLTTPLMDFFCIWFQSYLPNEVLLCNSLIATSLCTLIKEDDSIDALQRFYSKKSGFRRMKGTTVIVPIVDSTHWSLAILSTSGFFKFDSGAIDSNTFHGGRKLHDCLGKLWCMAIGESEGSPRWNTCTDAKAWTHVRCPKQSDGWSCGYYVMCFVITYMAFLGKENDIDWTAEVWASIPFGFYIQL